MRSAAEPGVILSEGKPIGQTAEKFIRAIAQHRHGEREGALSAKL